MASRGVGWVGTGPYTGLRDLPCGALVPDPVVVRGRADQDSPDGPHRAMSLNEPVPEALAGRSHSTRVLETILL